VTDFILAYAAGLLTLLNPCVLPLIPLIAAGAVARHPLGPLALAAGMGVSFTIAGLGAFWAARALGLTQSDIVTLAGAAMIAFGLVLVIKPAEAVFSRLAGAVAGGGTRLVGQAEGKGLAGEALAGALLGLAWSPCIGPTLGAAFGFAARGENLVYAGAIMVAFAAGAATIVLALAYGARSALTRRKELLSRITPYAKPILGAGLIAVGLAIVFHLDRVAEAWVLTNLPAWFTDLSVSI
jgi:cytochrome c-type biogenesis protein